jgi:DNA-directed RNA polymerase subunit H
MSTQVPLLINEIYKSRVNLLEIFGQLDYNVSDFEHFSINEVNVMRQNNQLDMLLTKDTANKDGFKEKIYIRFYLAKVLRPPNIRELIDDLFTLDEVLDKKDTLYIVIKDEPNDTLINDIKQIWEEENIFIIIQSIKRLQFNLLNHSLVPKHEIINEEELNGVMKKYNISKPELLPEISRFDPVAKAICIRPGQVCKITRPSKTAIETNYYRICINNR